MAQIPALAAQIAHLVAEEDQGGQRGDDDGEHRGSGHDPNLYQRGVAAASAPNVGRSFEGGIPPLSAPCPASRDTIH